MKVNAIMKTGLANNEGEYAFYCEGPAYSHAVVEIDITVSIRGYKAAVIVTCSIEGSNLPIFVYDSPEDIDKHWEIVSAPIMYNNPTSLDYEELHELYLKLYAHVLGIYRERKLNMVLDKNSKTLENRKSGTPSDTLCTHRVKSGTRTK